VVSGLLRSLTKPWRRRAGLDVPLGALLTALTDWLAPHSIFRSGDASALASGVIVASAALGALAITPVAIVLALTPGPRLRALMRSQVTKVRNAMSWAVVANLLAVAIGIADLVTDSSEHPEAVVRFALVTLEFAALLSMARLVWFFVSLLAIDEVDRSKSPEA
jgi:hypothetical protein